MVYPIYTYNESVLRDRAKLIDLNDDVSELITDMYETMKNANGIGLAAPQIGKSLRLIVIEEVIHNELFKLVMINPQILNTSNSTSLEKEGCLSFPGLIAHVSRFNMIEVEWYDENKKYHKEVFTGFKAQIIQHEIDHLNGVLFIDKMHPYEKMKLFTNLEHIKKKIIKTNYPIK